VKSHQVDRRLSLNSSPLTDSTGKPVLQDDYCTDEKFLTALDEEMAKVEKFTLSKVTELRTELTIIANKLENIKTEQDKAAFHQDM